MPLISSRFQLIFIHIDAFEKNSDVKVIKIDRRYFVSLSLHSTSLEMPNDKSSRNFNGRGHTDNGRSPNWEDKYGLVPPFLIGASTVIILYIIGHCLYLHCYTKREMKSYVARQHRNPTILVNDPVDGNIPLQPVTPIV